jgi:hypothetical protein
MANCTAKILSQLKSEGDVEVDIRVRGKDEASASKLSISRVTS